MTLEDHRWASGSHEPSEIIYKIVCVAVHFVEGEKSVYHPKQIRNTDPVQLSHFTDKETEAQVVTGTPPGHTVIQQGTKVRIQASPFSLGQIRSPPFTCRSLDSVS